jgi:hypothetical protein
LDEGIIKYLLHSPWEILILQDLNLLVVFFYQMFQLRVSSKGLDFVIGFRFRHRV